MVTPQATNLMITDQVIKEIYKKYNKPQGSTEALNLDYFLDLLSNHHNIDNSEKEVVIRDLEEFNPFRRFLKHSLNAVLEFDKMIAFVFTNHILFLGKETDEVRVHLKPNEPKSFLDKILGKKR